MLDRSPARDAIGLVVDLSRVRLIEGDITDTSALDLLISNEGVDRIVHTAALLSTAIRANPAEGVRVNVMGTLSVIDAARRHRLKRVVLASSTRVGYPALERTGERGFLKIFRCGCFRATNLDLRSDKIVV